MTKANSIVVMHSPFMSTSIAYSAQEQYCVSSDYTTMLKEITELAYATDIFDVRIISSIAPDDQIIYDLRDQEFYNHGTNKINFSYSGDGKTWLSI